jgi:hypothetical protein
MNPMKRRAKIAEEIMRTVPLEKIMGAAMLVMMHRRGVQEDDFSSDELIDFIESLDVDSPLEAEGDRRKDWKAGWSNNGTEDIPWLSSQH